MISFIFLISSIISSFHHSLLLIPLDNQLTLHTSLAHPLPWAYHVPFAFQCVYARSDEGGENEDGKDRSEILG